MKSIHLSFAATLAAMLTLSVAVAPSEASNMGGTSTCWEWYNLAFEQMRAGNHHGYEHSMKKYNECMHANWEGSVPKKHHHG